MVPHLKYATDEDLRQVGFSKPEIRRLRKFFEKYYPHGYLSKIKRLLQPPTKKDELTVSWIVWFISIVAISDFLNRFVTDTALSRFDGNAEDNEFAE